MSMGPPEDGEGEGSGNTTEGEGEDVTAGTVDFLFEADYDYAETDIEAPEGV
jgi:hypothetical protein